MGMSNITVTFRTAGETLTERNSRGSVFMILRGSVPASNPVTVTEEGEIPSSVSKENSKYIKMALKGAETAPKKVTVYFVGLEAEITDALAFAAVHYFDFIVMPTAKTDGLVDTIKDWVIAQKAFGNMVRAVLPDCAADSQYIINFVTEAIVTADGTLTAEQFCPRIAGIIAGTELSHSVTHTVIPEATDCTRLSTTEMDTLVNAGKLFVFFDGEKVKLSRGVNSLQTLTAEQNDQFKKIKPVETMVKIRQDLMRLSEDDYIGKFANTYSNRCILLAAFGDYFDGCVTDGLISSFEVGFNVLAIKNAMKKAGIDYSDMSDEQIVAYDFGTGVYISAKIRILDAIEDIDIVIEI